MILPTRTLHVYNLFGKHDITIKLSYLPENLSGNQFGLASPFHGNQVFFFFLNSEFQFFVLVMKNYDSS